MPWPKPAKSFRPGDRVVFSMIRHGTNPAVGAKDVRPEQRGEGYRYIIQDFWIVTNTDRERVVVKIARVEFMFWTPPMPACTLHHGGSGSFTVTGFPSHSPTRRGAVCRPDLGR